MKKIHILIRQLERHVILTFEKLEIIEPIQRSLAEEGYTTPTPIQIQAIPVVIKGRDLFGIAQTGTGKTAAFAVPILQELYLNKKKKNDIKEIDTLVLTPTRELAIQIADSFDVYGKYTGIRTVVVFGGVPYGKQTSQLQQGVDVLVATPGRLLDLIEMKHISLAHIKIFVLDEADRMLDMGFIKDVQRIIHKLPKKRQSLFFSATMPGDIIKLANTIVTNPVKIEVSPETPTVEAITQKLYFVKKQQKKELLIHLLKDKSIESALIFTRTKHNANKVADLLKLAGVSAEAIHGNKSQNARQKALGGFKSKQTRVLVATDIAARGIDIDELTHVFNYELPNMAETYIHRIGRTGRAGLSGCAISFCDAEEVDFLKDINKLIKIPIPVMEEPEYTVTFSKADQAAAQANVTNARNSRPQRRAPQRGANDSSPKTHAGKTGEKKAGNYPAPRHHSNKTADTRSGSGDRQGKQPDRRTGAANNSAGSTGGSRPVRRFHDKTGETRNNTSTSERQGQHRSSEKKTGYPKRNPENSGRGAQGSPSRYGQPKAEDKKESSAPTEKKRWFDVFRKDKRK